MTSSIPARVLVVSERPSSAGALASRLERLGLSAIVAPGSGAARALHGGDHDSVVLDASEGATFNVPALAAELRAGARPRSLCILAVVPEPLEDAAQARALDAVLIAPAHPAQIAARLRFLNRLSVMEDEARLRARTLANLGEPTPTAGDGGAPRGPVKALYVGEPARDYLATERALARAGGELYASFSTFAAFDFLHEADFDAVILNALGENDGAFTICSALRRNTRLLHLPTLMLVDMTRFRRAEEAFARGASDLIPADAEPAEVVARIMSLARERRRREELRAAFAAIKGGDVADPDTGLATPRFFMTHVQHMAERAQVLGRPLSLIILRADAPRDVELEARRDAYGQLGSMMRRLVRVEDLAARLDANVFAVATPGCDSDAAQTAAERLEAVGECTAFDGGALDDPFQMTLSVTLAELQPGESGRALMVRALNGFRAKADAKAG